MNAFLVCAEGDSTSFVEFLELRDMEYESLTFLDSELITLRDL